MRGSWPPLLCALALAAVACADDGPEQRQTVTAIGLFEVGLPDGWSVIVPTATDEDLSPVLSVGSTGQPVEDRVSVVFFDATAWETPEQAADEWTALSSVALDFAPFEEDGVRRLRDEFSTRNPEGEETGVSIIEILPHPGRTGEAWLVVVCGSGPNRLDETRDACEQVIGALEPWALD